LLERDVSDLDVVEDVFKEGKGVCSVELVNSSIVLHGGCVIAPPKKGKINK